MTITSKILLLGAALTATGCASTERAPSSAASVQWNCEMNSRDLRHVGGTGTAQILDFMDPTQPLHLSLEYSSRTHKSFNDDRLVPMETLTVGSLVLFEANGESLQLDTTELEHGTINGKPRKGQDGYLVFRAAGRMIKVRIFCVSESTDVY